MIFQPFWPIFAPKIPHSEGFYIGLLWALKQAKIRLEKGDSASHVVGNNFGITFLTHGPPILASPSAHQYGSAGIIWAVLSGENHKNCGGGRIGCQAREPDFGLELF